MAATSALHLLGSVGDQLPLLLGDPIVPLQLLGGILFGDLLRRLLLPWRLELLLLLPSVRALEGIVRGRRSSVFLNLIRIRDELLPVVFDLRQRHAGSSVVPQVFAVVQDLDQGLRESRVRRPLFREEPEDLLPYGAISCHQERQSRTLGPELFELLEVLERPLSARESADIQVLERHEESVESVEQRGHISHWFRLICPRDREEIFRVPREPGLHDDYVRPRPDLGRLVEGNYAVDEEVPRESLDELLVWLLGIDQDHVRVDPHETITELRVIFLRELWDLVRVFLHPSTPRGVLGLQSLSRLPDRGQRHDRQLLARSIGAERRHVGFPELTQRLLRR